MRSSSGSFFSYAGITRIRFMGISQLKFNCEAPRKKDLIYKIKELYHKRLSFHTTVNESVLKNKALIPCK